MTKPSVSVIIVSRGRPDDLRLCLTAVSQLHYDAFEIVVVSDQAGLDVVQSRTFSNQIKTALCEQANISVARNIGLDLSSGSIVAFIDDDSVPEPGWLLHLAAVFQSNTVAAATGYIRGKNGISYQSMATTIDHFGVTAPINIDGLRPTVFGRSANVTIKTIGTNCAFRRQVFEKLGGFDPGFAYFLDEADINIRLSNTEMETAIVPLAQVHHRVSASEHRLPNRAPRTLFQVGKSTAIFLRKHCPSADRDKAALVMEQLQQTQLTRHVGLGNCDQNEADRLMATMRAGVVAGQSVKLEKPRPIAPATGPFTRFSRQPNTGQHLYISGFWLFRRRLRNMAAAAVARGDSVTLFIFSLTTLFHKMRFHRGGYWVQTGGLFGRSERTERLFRWYFPKDRAAKERKRLALVRHPWDIEGNQTKTP
ncbi:MAG: glycosyltransferase family A protein [Paracoccaceae bacterium]